MADTIIPVADALAVMEECAAALCSLCADGDVPAREAVRHLGAPWTWWHEGNGERCMAGRVHDLMTERRAAKE